ncbi:MAG: phospholipase D family protein [Methylococcales bacterium]|nr:phospholipase D family protein [Methylococcales bacterium]
MAKFLNTSATNYFLEELIKNAKDRLILISPFFKLNDRMRELLADKNRLKIDMRIVYGKSELAPEELNWLKTQSYIRTSFCKNLHAKCYLNEDLCIITSLNLYEFSQINNNEMGVLINRNEDVELYKDAYEEAQRIIRISEEVNNLSPEIVLKKPEQKIKTDNNYEKLTTSKLAQKLGLKTDDLTEKLINLGYLEIRDDKQYLTTKGKEAGGEVRTGKQFGIYFLWDGNFNPEAIKKLRTAELAEKLGFSTNELIVKLINLEYLEIRDKKPYLTEKGKLAGGELRDEQSGYNCFWAEDFFLAVEKINSVKLAKKLGITIDELIDKLVTSEYLKQDMGWLIFPHSYYLTEKGKNAGIEETEISFTNEDRFIYPENIKF